MSTQYERRGGGGARSCRYPCGTPAEGSRRSAATAASASRTRADPPAPPARSAARAARASSRSRARSARAVGTPGPRARALCPSSRCSCATSFSVPWFRV